MHNRFQHTANAGTLVFLGANCFIKVQLAAEQRMALLGYRPDQYEDLITIGRNILSANPQRTGSLRQRALVECAAILRNGLDSELAGTSLLALTALVSRLDNWFAGSLGYAQAYMTKVMIDGKKQLIAETARPEACDFGSLPVAPDGSVLHLWVSEQSQSQRDLIVLIANEGPSKQIFHIPAGRVNQLIATAEEQFASEPLASQQMKAIESVLDTVFWYHRSLEGLSTPTSVWGNWAGAKERFAGIVAWLLRERGILATAFDRAEDHAVVITPPAGPRDEARIDLVSFEGVRAILST
ncbi:hypothetical protein [Aminobacter sp. AP02]|uniref:hypothetical protein n=1 Tax=Aminobacter sp. AP02 TaxID=2135737 RepID=UPI0011B22916|nr:hypothetical protein [Aminobacter sp. AP02]